MNLPTQPYKGARDFYPSDQAKRNYMFDVMKRVVRSFGYEQYDAPLIEPIEIYQAKSGEEIVNEQTYTFIDRGDRKVAIRPEMTPSVSRMVAAKRQELSYPLRWFSIPNLWRYERPQRGRFREHWQLNVDLFGVSNIAAELELIMIADSIFKAYGAQESMYAIRINHRELLDEIFLNKLKMSPEQAVSLSHLIDRRAKLSHSQFLDLLDRILTPLQKENGIAEELLSLFDANSIDQLPKDLLELKPVKDIQALITACNTQNINNISFDISLVRGFDYYSGIVFELYDSDPENNRSMIGGGRYDGLVGLFGVDPLPTVGFGMGDATLTNFLENHHLMPELSNVVAVYVAPIGGDDSLSEANKVASLLRQSNINVAVDISGRKLGDQIKTAQKKAIKYVLIIGSKEIETQKYTLRDLDKSSEATLTLKQLIDKFS